MSRRARREMADSGLAFLDVISCGFGAVILLLIITKTVEPVILEQSTAHLEGMLAKLQRELFDIRGETREVNRQVADRRAQLEEALNRVAVMEKDLSRIKGAYQTTQEKVETTTKDEQRLADAKQSLTEEMKRLLGDRAQPKNDLVGGIPVDSEYIVFVIDTSGSMFNYAWTLVLQKIEETLAIYPQVKGIQVMNDMGDYMFPNYAGQWIPDSPGRRRVILQRLQTWNPFSNSSPVEGITRAIADFGRSGKKISIYVFGDEFTGDSIKSVVDTVDRLNREDAEGNRLVRIHGVGFPTQFSRPPNLQTTGIRFAALMRELARRNGGTFVGLDRFQP